VQDITVKNISIGIVLKTPLIPFICKYVHGFTL
jgi:hypothetical protein